jgi:hypothetical protein
MKSYEAMGLCVGRDRVVHAKALHKSVHLVSKWTEPAVDFTDSGTFNPLDRLEVVMDTALRLGTVDHAHALAPLFYLAQRFDCAVYPLPRQCGCLKDVSAQLGVMVREFGQLMASTGEAMADGRISPDERRRIERAGVSLMEALGAFMNLVGKESV